MTFDVNDPRVLRWLEQQKALQSVGVEPAAASEPVVEDSNIEDETAVESDPIEQQTEVQAQQLEVPAPEASPTPAPLNAAGAPQPNIREVLFGKNDLSTVDALKKAQADRNSRNDMADIQHSAALIGESFSGIENKDLRSMSENTRKRADESTKDFTAQVEIQKKDPKSAVSQGYKQFLEQQMGIKLGGDVSAADIEPFLTASMKKQVQAKAFQQGFVDENGNKLVFNPNTGKYENSGLKAADQMFQVRDPLTSSVQLLGRRAKPGGGLDVKGVIGAPKEATGEETSGHDIYSTLPDKERTKVDKTKELFLKDTTDDRNAVVAAGGIKTMLQSGEEMGGDVLRAIQNQLARANGEKGAMTEQDVNGFGGKADLMSRFTRAVSMAATGQMTDSDREFLSKLSDVMERRANDYINKQSQVYSDNISTVSGLDDNKARTLLGVEKTMTSNRNKPKQDAKAPAGKKIVKKGYNSSTDETQLIYDDGSKEIKKGKQ